MRFGLPSRFLTAALVVGWAAASVLHVNGQIKPPELKINQSELKNGLKVVLHEDHAAPVINLQVWYHVGSKDEKQGQSGFAHLFEHIMFKGSKNIEPEEHGRYIEETGGELNAYTSFDQTVYWQTIPANQLEQVIWLEAERMRSLKVDEKNFTSERSVVLEEKRLRVDNPPYGRLAEIVFTNSFKSYPYAHQPIGSAADLNAAKVADVKAFHDRFYVPDNATLVVVGDFKTADALKFAEKYFGSIPRGATPVPRVTLEEPDRTAERRVIEYDAKAPLPAVIIAYPTPERANKDRYALELAGNILSQGESSRLHKSLVYEKQIALAAAGQNFNLEKAGLFFFFSVLAPGKQAEEGEKALAAEIDKMMNEAVSADELEKAKVQLVSGLVSSRKSAQGKADAIGAAAVFLGGPQAVNEELKSYQAVTVADIQRVAKTYFKTQNRLVVYMLPESLRPKKDASTSSQKGN